MRDYWISTNKNSKINCKMFDQAKTGKILSYDLFVFNQYMYNHNRFILLNFKF